MDIKLTITVTGKPTFTLTQDNLYDQEFSLGYGASDFSFGLFNAGNFNFTIANEDLQYSRDDFAGARIKLEYGTQTMGWYNVNRIKEQDDGYALEIQCYDDILKFDCPFTATESDFPMSFEKALSHCMYLAGLATTDFDTTSLAVITRSEVADISIQKSFMDAVDNYTCRDVIRAIAELSCCQATLDTDGRLLLNNPFRGSSFEQDLSDRVAMEYDRETKPISKVKVTTVPSDGTSETFEYGTDTGHTVDFTLPTFSGCLLRDDILSIVQSAHNQLNGRAVSALSATHEIMGDEIKLYRVGDRYLADDTSGEPLRKRLDGMITSIRYSGNFEFSYSCPGFSQDGNGTSASGNPSGSIVAKVLAPVSEEIRRSNAQLSGLISSAKAELSDAIEILDGDFGVVSQQVGEIQSDIYGLQVNYADIFAEMYDTEQGVRARLYKAETEIVAQAGLITSKVGQTEYDEFVSDIYGVTESIEQDLSVVEQTAQSVSATVSSHTGQISGLDGRLTSAQAQINIQADQISQTVSKTDFNNLQIGGRNYLRRQPDRTIAGMTITTSDDGWITLNGTNTAQSTAYFGSRDLLPGNPYSSGNFMLSANNPEAVAGVGIRTRSLAGTDLVLTDVNASRTLKPNASVLMEGYWIYVLAGVTLNNFKLRPKLEKGDKATDWSPAIEDVDSAIATVDGKFTNYSTTEQMNSAIDQTADSITSTVSTTYATKATVEAVDGKFTNYYTKTQSDSQISQLSDGIALRVTKTEFNNLQISGRNLVKNTAFASNTQPPFIDYNGATHSVITDNGELVLQVTPLTGATSGIFISNSGLTESYEIGDNVCVSFWIKGDSIPWSSLHFEQATAIQTINKKTSYTTWEKVTWIGKKTEATGAFVWYVNSLNTGIPFYLKKIKFEKSTKATDWSPAPEDVDSAIATVDGNLSSLTERVNTAELKITDSAIVSTVRSSTQYTNDLGAKTNKTEIISTINQSAEAVEIDASKINLNGVVTANNNFKINLDGSMETIAGKIGDLKIDNMGLSHKKVESGITYDFVINAEEGLMFGTTSSNYTSELSYKSEYIEGLINHSSLGQFGFDVDAASLNFRKGVKTTYYPRESLFSSESLSFMNYGDGYLEIGTYGIDLWRGLTPNPSSAGIRINDIPVRPILTGSYAGNGANGRTITITGLTQSSEVFIINANSYAVLGKKAVSTNTLQVNAVSGENTTGVTYRYVAIVI